MPANDDSKSPVLHRHACPRTHRLSGEPAFAKVYDAKAKESRGPLTVFSLPNGRNHPRLGISISRRVGTAPVRNRIKRLLREVFRAHQHDVPVGYDLIVVVRPHKPMALGEYDRLLSELMRRSHAAWERRGMAR